VEFKKPIDIEDSLNLSDFFSLVNSEKKRQKDEFTSIVGDLNLSNVFEEVTTLKKKNKIQKKKEQKTLESFENWLYSDKVKEKPIEEVQEIVEEVIEEVQEIVDNIVEESSEKPKELTLIEKSLGLLAEPSDAKVQQDPLAPLDQKFATIEDLQKHYNLFLNRIQQQLSTLGGGGETNLAYMDMPLTYITTSSYTITPQDYYIGVNYAGAVTITLPTPRKDGKTYIVKDELGEASRGVNRYITILPSGSDTIDGRDRAIIAYDYGSLTFVYRNGWRVV
jgi:predicted transcriptional regulator